MQAAQASASDSKILSGKLLTETNKAATAKMLPTTTKKTGLLLRYRQAITTRNTGIITSILIVVSLSPAAHWRQAYHSSAFLDGDAGGELYRRFI
jgi:hypothetical protein